MGHAIRIAALAALLVTPAAARAQEALERWPGLDVSGLQTVYVTDTAGGRYEGRLVRLDPDALVVLVNGMERRFDRSTVARLDRRGDSLRNGAIIGALVGVVMGVLSAGIADCSGDDPGGSCPGTRVAIVAVSTGFYAGIGTGIDALVVGRTRVYDAGSAAGAAVPGRQLALRFTLGW